MSSKIIPAAVALLISVAIAPTSVGAPEELKRLQMKYSVERERLDQPIVLLREQYQAHLVKLQEEFSQAGDLTNALAARKAAAAGDPSPETIVDGPDKIAQVQKRFLEQKAAKEGAALLKLIALTKSYGQHLVKLRTTLTKEGKLDDALVVDSEIKKITAGLAEFEKQSNLPGRNRTGGRILSIPVEADAHVRSEMSGSKLGKAELILTKDEKGGSKRWGFLRFDLSRARGAGIDSATIRLRAEHLIEQGERGEMFAVSDDSWEEEKLTWNNRPERGDLIASWPRPKVGDYVEIDVTDTVRQELRGDGKLSVCLYVKGKNGIAYASREGKDQAAQPTLVVRTY